VIDEGSDVPESSQDRCSARVEFAEFAACSLALPTPVRLGDAFYPSRDYVALRLVDSDGLEGYAFGYSRGTPLAVTLEQVVRAIAGTPPRDRVAMTQRILASSPAVRPLLVRAVSLVDIALWDLTCKRAGLPLSGMLGCARDRLAVMPVAGYFRDVRGDDAVLGELEEYESRGFAQIKLMIGALHSTETMAFLARAREVLAADTRIVVDAHYSLNGVPDAVRTAEALRVRGVSLLEDPFIPTAWRKLRELRQQSRMELAAGEDVVDPMQYLDLLESVSVLRVDPTTCGGIRPSITGIEAAAARGVEVIPHVFTAIGAQLGGSFDAIHCVEHISPSVGADPIDRYFEHDLDIGDGEIIIDRQPGVGVHLDWGRLRQDSESVVSVRPA